jgi:hypothetical protein
MDLQHDLPSFYQPSGCGSTKWLTKETQATTRLDRCLRENDSLVEAKDACWLTGFINKQHWGHMDNPADSVGRGICNLYRTWYKRASRSR